MSDRLTSMIHFEQVSFRYPDAPAPVLRDVTFALPASSFTLVVAPSGMGKSTLLRCINGLVPHFSGGTFAGRVTVQGLDPVKAGPEGMFRHVGFVFQDPETQFVMDRVEDEIAFALENVALSRREMVERVTSVLDRLALRDLRDRPIRTLSGGEKQRVAIAAALALRPGILVLDEPTSQLDPQSAENVLTALAHLNRALGLTIVLSEHRLERVLPFADRMVYLPSEDEGRGVVVGTPPEVLAQIDLVPPIVELGKALSWSPLPLTVEAAHPFAQATNLSPPSGAHNTLSDPGSQPVCLRDEAVEVAYEREPVLHGVDFDLHLGEVTVLMGRNGAGKSTLLKTLVGLARPHQGRVLLRDCITASTVCTGRPELHDTADMTVAEICRRVAYLPQDPNALLFAESVYDELLVTLRNHGIVPADAPVVPDMLLASLGLAALADAYPRDLSVGERQRVALGAMLVTAPSVVLLDEPTRGLDYQAKVRLLALIRRWRDEGRAVLLVTHDVELAASAADRVVVMHDGRIAVEGAPADVLGSSSLFAPQIARLFPDSGWLTVEDVLAHLDASR